MWLMYSAEAREMVCYACIFGLDDSKPSEKSEGMCLHFKYFSDSFEKNCYIYSICPSEDMSQQCLCSACLFAVDAG